MEAHSESFQQGTILAIVLQNIIGIFCKECCLFLSCLKYLPEGKWKSVGLILFAKDIKMSKQGKKNPIAEKMITREFNVGAKSCAQSSLKKVLMCNGIKEC